MSEFKGWVMTERVGVSILNPKPVCSVPITDEMWAVIKERAAEAGMDPVEYFDKVIADANAEDKR